MGVAIEINGSQFFERVCAIYLPNESFGEKKSGLFFCFLFIFLSTFLPRTDFNAISMTGIPYVGVIEKKKKIRSE